MQGGKVKRARTVLQQRKEKKLKLKRRLLGDAKKAVKYLNETFKKDGPMVKLLWSTLSNVSLKNFLFYIVKVE